MKRRNKLTAGFTLIELLVVIAIIGLLAAVVLASVGSARNKGADAAVQSQLNAARSQAELFAGANGQSYEGVCADTQGNYGLDAIVAEAGAATNGTATCYDEDTAWALSAPLTDGTHWCVDSIGASKSEPDPLDTDVTACP